MRLKKAVVLSKLGGEVFLYDGDDDAVHILNPSAGLILDAHLQGRTVEEIARALREAYFVEPDRDLRTEIRRFIERMERKEILVS